MKGVSYAQVWVHSHFILVPSLMPLLATEEGDIPEFI